MLRNRIAALCAIGLWAAAFPAAAAPVYTVSDGATVWNINPIYRPAHPDVFDYYSYGFPNGSSSNTVDGLERADTISLFLYEGESTSMKFVQIIDAPGDSDGHDVHTSIAMPGLEGSGNVFDPADPANVYWEIQDDPGSGSDSYDIDTANDVITTTHSGVACCSDGFGLGFDLSRFGETMEWTVSYTLLNGVDALNIWYFEDPYEQGGTPVLSSISLPLTGTTEITFTRSTAEAPAALPESGLPVFPAAAALLMAGTALRRRNGRRGTSARAAK